MNAPRYQGDVALISVAAIPHVLAAIDALLADEDYIAALAERRRPGRTEAE